MLTTRLARYAMLGTLAYAAACSDSTAPTTASVAGSYQATSFTTTESGVTVDQLQRGSTLTVVLTAQGGVSGALFIPADATNPELDASMAGTWSLNGSTVSFDQAADTFVRDMNFIVVDSKLVGDQLLGSTRIQVTLTRT